jgi:uncharacterized membrane protein
MLKSLTQNFLLENRFRNWRGLLADFVLTALLSGPIIAPFLEKAGFFPVNVIAKIIYFMGGVVCPQPEMSLMVTPPHLMAVCMRCYGLLLALLTTRLAYIKDRGRSWYWLSQYRFTGAAIASIMICAYLGEMLAQIFHVWDYNNWIVTVFGYITGLGIGLFFVPVLHRRID